MANPPITTSEEIKMATFTDPFEGQDGRIVTPKEIGDALYLSDKTVRDRMRKMTDKSNQPGSGGRWDIEVGTDSYFVLIQTLQVSRGFNKPHVSFVVKSNESTD
jgi:hypothetical protein